MLSLNTTTKALSTLVNPDKTFPVALIEGACTAGRTYNGYKRGGKVEGRERLREETTTAIFWLFGVKVLNSIGDAIGKKLGLKYLNVDLGRDELRAPVFNIPKDARMKTCAFKFGKVAASALIATALTGFIIPKINHLITDKSRMKGGLEPVSDKNNTKSPENNNQRTLNNTENNLQNMPAVATPAFAVAPSFETFLNNAKKSAPSFKGIDGVVNTICKISHFAENTTAGRLASTDAGMIFGRVKNSRNPFEGFEFAFRDTASVYFYLFATPHTAVLLNKLTGNTPIHPDVLKAANNHLVNSVENYLNDASNPPLTVEKFIEQTKKQNANMDDILSKIPFSKKGVISLDEFNNATKYAYDKKALEMSQLQPLLNGKSVLSKMQVEDILSDGWNTDATFLKKALNAGTYGAASDKNKYVSRKLTENIRTSIDTYTQNLAKYAKKKGCTTIDANLLQKFAKHTANLNLAFRIAGLFVSAFGLAYLIPKIQYKITEIRTGSKAFPGTADYSDSDKTKNAPAAA